MSERSIFDVPRLPARSNVRQVASLLGFQEYEIPILTRAKLLTPLGSPAQNGHKYFSTVEILELATDRSWLDRATRTVTRFVQKKDRKSKVRKQVADCGETTTQTVEGNKPSA
jgi:hypothetical protein